MSRGRWALGFALVVLVASGALGYRVVFGGRHAPPDTPAASGTSTRGPDRTLATATAFLRAWAAGDLAGAAALTDEPKAARARLAELSQNLSVTRAGLVPHAVAADGTVPFTATLTLGKVGTWTYDSAVPVYRNGDTWRVRWSPAVLNPHLSDAVVLRLGDTTSSPQRPAIADRAGTPITAAAHPSLSGILRGLAARLPARPPLRPGTAVQVVTRGTTSVIDELATVRDPVPAESARTTLDSTVQAAAEKAVAQAGPGTALVAIRPSTGGVLAVANNPATGFDTALLAGLAPGSTMKVITSAAVLSGGLSPADVVPCPPSVDVGGKVFRNAGGESFGNVSLATDFAVSCNTAFIGLADRISDGALADEAGAVFGVTAPWDIGLGQTRAYASVPVPSDPIVKAADMIGQGEVQMSPLAMASVAATVESGVFRQPVVLPGTPRHGAARALPGPVAAELRSMMRQVVTRGTAKGSLGDLPGGVSAKTGTAEVAGQPANGWMIAFRGDLAVACVVQGGDAGEGSAGPVVRRLLMSVT